MSVADPRAAAGASDLFDDYLLRVDAGEDVDFQRLCDAHPELAAELRELLEVHRSVNRLLPGPLDDATALARTAAAAEPSNALLETLRDRGVRGARYSEFGEVARGGMGAIISVWDDELKRRLAMKVMLRADDASRSPDPRRLHRFLEEAQVTGQLDHPGIVPVHELGLGEDGGVYYTMRLVRGDDLRKVFERVRNGADGWNLVRALNVMMKVCEAMSYAHSKGVLHRDLKPANVMVGQFGEVYVMDWGLARVIGRADAHDLRIDLRATAPPTASPETDSQLYTMDGEVLGTPAFMPPEQARCEVDRLGAHSDVYAVGAMLYQLLGGEMPFVPSGERAPNRVVLERVKAGPPASLRALAPEAPAELVAICEKAMSRSIEARYADMSSLAEDLRAYIEGRVVRAYETGTLAETRNWVRRHRALVAALAAAVLILVAGAVTTFIFAAAETRLNQAAREMNDVFFAMQQLDDFERESGNVDFGRTRDRATEWWLETARGLLVGSPGLAGTRRLLASVTAEAKESRVDPARYPRAVELAAKQNELLWLSRMAGLADWPTEAQEAESIAQSLPTNWIEANRRAFNMTDPRTPIFGLEVRGLVLAKQAAEMAEVALAYPATATDEDHKAPWMIGDTLSWAHFRRGEFDEARAAQRDALASKPDAWSTFGLCPRLEDAIADWTDGTAERRRVALAAEVATLEREAGEWCEYEFEERGRELWRDQLVRFETRLARLARRLESAERAVSSTDAHERWSAAIAAIERHPRYGFTITPQLDLVPIGANRDSSLWEFAHLPSGVEARFGTDGRSNPTPETGLVFVLLPAGRVGVPAPENPGKHYEVVLDPFFLSKYEMTQLQWRNLETDWPGRFRIAHTQQPATSMTFDDCTRLFAGMPGWLQLPSQAQWEYGCRAGTSGRRWTGDTPESMRGAEHVDFGDGDLRHMHVARIGTLRANAFGLHDMLGNVSEWCRDLSHNFAVPRSGDGLREDSPDLTTATRTALGGVHGHPADKVDIEQRGGGEPFSVAPDTGLRPARPLTP